MLIPKKNQVNYSFYDYFTPYVKSIDIFNWIYRIFRNVYTFHVMTSKTTKLTLER